MFQENGLVQENSKRRTIVKNSKLLKSSIFNRRQLIFMLGIIGAFVLLINSGRVTYAAPNNVTIINLRDAPIFVAYGIDQWGDNGDLKSVPERWLSIRCWYRIEPGQSRDFSANQWFHVSQNGNRITWSNTEEKFAVIIRGHSCGDSLRVRYDYATGRSTPVTQSDLNRLTSQGYERVPFQKLASGNYTVSGSGYELHSSEFEFEFGSHDTVTHRDCFEVSGSVVNYIPTVQRRHGPYESWRVDGNNLCLTVITQGHQPNPWSARERGYFIGSVRVYYTVTKSSTPNPNPNPNGLSLQSGFLPDPRRIQVVAGGSETTNSCAGFYNTEPTLQLNWSGSSDMLRFYVTSSADTTLLVRDPAGVLHCNDDWKPGDTDPMKTFSNPHNGRYTIWVGTYSNSTAYATLNITEISTRNPGSP